MDSYDKNPCLLLRIYPREKLITKCKPDTIKQKGRGEVIGVFVLAFALSMDAFAVAIALGARCGYTHKLALKIAFAFGVAQMGMPLAGFLLGAGFYEYVKDFDHWLAFLLLAGIGCKMIYEAHGGDELAEESCELTSARIATLALATSLDAMAAGLTLSLFALPLWLCLVMIGAVTFLLSFSGIFFGGRGGIYLQEKAEYLGGAMLIAIGAKILYEHLWA